MMKAAWGQKWSDQVSSNTEFDLAVKVWGESLFCLTGEQIATAFHKSKKEFKWPPSVAEFIEQVKPRLINSGMYRERNPERLIESDELKKHRRVTGVAVIKSLKDKLKGSKC